MSDEIQSGLIQDVQALDPAVLSASGTDQAGSPRGPRDADGTDKKGDTDGTDGSDADGTDGADSDGTDGGDTDGTDGSDADGTDGGDSDGSDSSGTPTV